MLKNGANISDKKLAYNGAVIAIAAVFVYSIIVMIYVIIRSSVTIFSIMPKGEIKTILWANGISVAYSVAVFSMILSIFSAGAGAITSVILKKSLLYFNPRFNLRKALLISSITALGLLIITYLFLYVLLKDWMTFNYTGTFLFWYLFPAAIFFPVCVFGGSRLNTIFAREIQR